MGRLLFLTHRLPYPPDKGDRIRSWHMLDHLARRWEVDLGCLSDDPADAEHLPMLRQRCAAVHCEPIAGGALAALRTLSRARPGLPLTLGWFHAPGLQAWVEASLATRRHDAVFVYSSAMAPYVMRGPRVARRVLDLVDVDSEKWRAYAAAAHPPRRQLWAREARTLLAFERRAACFFDRTLLVSEPECARFLDLAPEARGRAGWVENGVDLDVFDPGVPHADPYPPGAPALVFTGTMDYPPNIEAVRDLAREVLPRLRAQPGPAPEFHIVGARPTAEVRALAALPGVHVTGRVPDTRPYIAHAAAAVAPLRVARGIQNKVLEAMAMARPVIASTPAFEGIKAMPGRDLLVSDGAEATAQAVRAVLRGEWPGLGAAARAAVATGHDWAVTLGPLDAMLRVREAALVV
ncbi:TIGR03087 family PEP-CTERM/XrtA system glycosyltransferase [Sediminicoccus sp. BL-A-41-H5]|uniref:TIGR03087 family PEP-CTERM/XrtA system glycosyltransferase n=1 Tax=Sediminicoccus sp. BL-A-41-H5 TaxID=3421106 RepID=UPI003D67E565